MKAHDEAKKTAIRLVLAARGYEEIARQRSLEEADVLQVLEREVKQHRESLAEYEKAGRAKLIAEEQAQLAVLLSYLPQQLSHEELVAAAKQAIAEVGAESPSQTGQVMRVLMPRLKGKADGREANLIVQGLLAASGQSGN